MDFCFTISCNFKKKKKAAKNPTKMWNYQEVKLYSRLGSYLLISHCLCLSHRLPSQETEALVHAPAEGKKCKKDIHPVYLSSTLKATSQNKLVHHTVTLNHKIYTNLTILQLSS